VEEVDVPQTEDLFAGKVVPGGLVVEVEAAVHLREDVPEHPAHEGLVLGVHGVELRSVTVVVNVGRVLFVDKALGFLLDSVVDDVGELLAPDLLALDVQEVLDVLDASFESHKVGFKTEEFSFVNAELAHGTLFRVVHISCGLVRLFENELLMEHRRHLLAQFLPEPVNQDLLRLDLRHAHQNLIQHQHPLSEHSDPVGPFSQLVPLLELASVSQCLLRDPGFKLINVFRKDIAYSV
jgi:hypothetical protein